jgi:eukaryotic-like serine/threonine-protein kinase
MALLSHEDPMVGVVVDGRYRIIERIGQGGAGVLYRAEQLAIGRDIALKMLSAYSLSDERAEHRFENEARIVSKLHHPRTLKLFDYGRTPDGKPYIACELLRGAPLNKLLQREGPLEAARTMRFLADICGSLDEAHKLGVVHRDLKPANVFIEQVGTEEHAKVLDFGIAKIVNQESVTAVGTVIGTPAYMPPECSSGAVLDARSDIYSLGVTAFECLTGMKPYHAELPMAVLQMHVYHPVPRVTGVPAELAELVARMMAKDPRQRPQSAAEVRLVLQEIARAPLAVAPVPRLFWAKLAAGAVAIGLLTSATVRWARPPPVTPVVIAPKAVEVSKREVSQPEVSQPEVSPPVIEAALPEGDATIEDPPRTPVAVKSKRPRRAKVVQQTQAPAPAAVVAPRGRVTIEVWTTAGRILPAEISVDGARASSPSLELTAGTHTIEVRPQGYPTQKKTVQVTAERSTTVRFVAD